MAVDGDQGGKGGDGAQYGLDTGDGRGGNGARESPLPAGPSLAGGNANYIIVSDGTVRFTGGGGGGGGDKNGPFANTQGSSGGGGIVIIAYDYDGPPGPILNSRRRGTYGFQRGNRGY